MCKLAMMPHIQPQYAAQALRLAQHMTPPMTAWDKDAFGVAAITNNDVLYTGKWEVKDSWSTQGLVKGPYPKRPKSIILHSRMATHGQGLINAHPHINPERTVALIHNGIVDTRTLDLRRTQCDSEGILNAYTDAGVEFDANEMQTALERVQGYYALGIYSRVTPNGQWFLDIVRDSIAPLYYVYIESLKLPVFLTDPKHVFEAARKMNLNMGQTVPREIKPNVHIRYNTATGERVHTADIVPTDRYSADEARYMAWRGHMGSKVVLV